MTIIWVSMNEIQADVPRNKMRASVITDRCLKQGQCAWNQGQDA